MLTTFYIVVKTPKCLQPTIHLSVDAVSRLRRHEAASAARREFLSCDPTQYRSVQGLVALPGGLVKNQRIFRARRRRE